MFLEALYYLNSTRRVQDETDSLSSRSFEMHTSFKLWGGGDKAFCPALLSVEESVRPRKKKRIEER